METFNEAISNVNSIAALFDKTDVCVFFSDPDTNEVIYVNDMMREEFDCGNGPLKCRELMCPAREDSLEPCSCEALRSVDAPPVVRFIYHEGKGRYYKKVDSLIKIGDGKLVHMHHITGIPSLHTDKEKTDFLSRMSHELYTPMNAIMSMASVAAATEDLEKMKSCVSIIYSASTRLNDIISDVLDMSRMELGQVSLVKLPFELEKMLVTTCNVAVATAYEAGRPLNFDIEKNVPARLRGDEVRLSQVINSVLVNTVRFSIPASEINIRVKRIDEIAGRAVLEFGVEYPEAGMTAEGRAQLFSAFEQASYGEYSHYGESGLGFTISKKIVEMMDGSIRIEKIGKTGASLKFTVRIDIFENDTADKAAARGKHTEHTFARRENAGAGDMKPGAIKVLSYNSAPPPYVSDEDENTGYAKYLPYIDIEEGLSHVGGNKKLFASMLRNFKDGTICEDFTKSIEGGDPGAFQRHYATLKNVAQNLSLTKLYKNLIMFENRLKKPAAQKSVLPEINVIFSETNKRIEQFSDEYEYEQKGE